MGHIYQSHSDIRKLGCCYTWACSLIKKIIMIHLLAAFCTWVNSRPLCRTTPSQGFAYKDSLWVCQKIVDDRLYPRLGVYLCPCTCTCGWVASADGNFHQHLTTLCLDGVSWYDGLQISLVLWVSFVWEPGEVVHACHLSTWKTKGGGWQIWPKKRLGQAIERLMYQGAHEGP